MKASGIRHQQLLALQTYQGKYIRRLVYHIVQLPSIFCTLCVTRDYLGEPL